MIFILNGFLRQSHLLDRDWAAGERNGSRAGNLDDAILMQDLAERVDLALCACELDDDVFRRDIDDVRAEDVDDVDDVAARLARRAQLRPPR